MPTSHHKMSRPLGFAVGEMLRGISSWIYGDPESGVLKRLTQGLFTRISHGEPLSKINILAICARARELLTPRPKNRDPLQKVRIPGLLRSICLCESVLATLANKQVNRHTIAQFLFLL